MEGKDQHQHYLPQSYLNGFADSDGAVWRFDRKFGKCAALHPKVIGAENNLYSIEGPSGKSQILESRFMQMVDGPFAEIARKLHRHAEISLEEMDSLATFVSILIARSPARIRETETRFQQIDRLIGPNPEQVRFGPPALDERADESEPRTTRFTLTDEQTDPVQQQRSEMGLRTVALRALLSAGLEGAARLHELRWSILRSPSGRRFVVSDDPGVIVGGPRPDENDGVGPLTPGAVTYVPLSSTMCLRLSSPMAGVKQLQSCPVDGATVRLLNRSQLHNSERFLHGPNCQLIDSLTRRGTGSSPNG